MKTYILAAMAAVVLAGSSAYAAPSVSTVETSAGKVLAGKNGMTLYTYTEDAQDKSNCYGECAANWPPFLAEKNAVAGSGYTIVKRTDGTSQWAFKGKPLYYWIKDVKKGDTTGNGVGGVWDLARP